jgi:phenylacetate-CoA ligase
VLVFNTDLCIVELVDSANQPVPPGVPSAKVLVTNLYNLTQPLIRYELADSFVRQPDAPGHGHLQARVHGRADEVLHYQTVASCPLPPADRTPDPIAYSSQRPPVPQPSP